MLICQILMMLLSTVEVETAEDMVRELVYQAEVFGRREQSENALKEMLAASERPERNRIIRALALVKYQTADRVWTEQELAQLSDPRAVLFRAGLVYLLGATWLESGDWVGDYFLLAVEAHRVLLESRTGFRKEIVLNEPLQGNGESLCLLRRATVADVLTFAARKAKLNTFLPSSLSQRITGRYPLVNWLSLLDSVCRETGLTWTRRRDNIMIRSESAPGNARHYKTLTSKNEPLPQFLEALTKTFGLELELDERLSDITVDIYAQEQPWDETLDCLAMMNHFNWDFVQAGNSKLKLIITRNDR